MKNQVLHIFRKDVRHHWPEIVLSLALVVAYAWQEVTKYSRWGNAPDELSLIFPVSLLLVLAWVFLILRVVQGECLVGDKQFWVTRPYEWPKLLAAKLLFILTFFNVPLFILQAFLLLMAGYSPNSHIRGLLWLQVLWTLILVMPATTLSTVTASIGQFILAVLGLLLYSTLVFPAMSSLVPAAEVQAPAPVLGDIQVLLPVGVALSIIFWQYARRKTWRSRLLLVSFAVVIPLAILIIPYTLLIERAYPQASAAQQLPVRLAFDPAKPTSLQGGYPEKNNVHVRVPLVFSGVASGSWVSVAGVQEQILAPGERPWNSGWRGNGTRLLAGRQHAQLDITIDKGYFERVKSASVRLRITFALAPAHAKQTTHIVAQSGSFRVPGEGRCSFPPMFQGEMVCVFPLKTPFFLMTARSDELTCTPQKREPLPAGLTLYGGNFWNPDSAPADFGINPVEMQPVGFWDWGETRETNYHARVCPGTPLTFFTDWEDLPRLRTDLEIEGIRLQDYKLADTAEGSGFVGFSVP